MSTESITLNNLCSGSMRSSAAWKRATSRWRGLSLFEEGTRLAGSCSRLLDEAELKVVQLTKGADGAPQETELADAGI